MNDSDQPEDRGAGVSVPTPPGGPDQWQRIRAQVKHLIAVVRSAKRCGFWAFRGPLSNAVDWLERETAISAGSALDPEGSHLNTPSATPEWADFVHKIQDVVLMEEVLRQHCYQQCIQPFLTVVSRLRAAVMIPESVNGECPACGSTHLQRSAVSEQTLDLHSEAGR